MKNALAILSVLGLALAATIPAGADEAADFPNKPIRLIVPFEPGGGGDSVVLTFIDELSRLLGQPVLKENHGGGNSVIGTNLLARSPADGYTIGVVTSGFVSNPFLLESLPYDSQADLVPVSLLVQYPFTVGMRTDFPAETIEDFVEYVRENPGMVTSANSGRGSGSEFATGHLSALAGLDIAHIPFPGAGPALIAVAGGFVDIAFANHSSIQPFVERGEMRYLGTAGATALTNPDVRSIGEVVDGFEYSQWWVVLAPAGVPSEIMGKLETAVQQVLTDPTVVERLSRLNAEIVASNSEDARAFLQDQTAQAAMIVEYLGLVAE